MSNFNKKLVLTAVLLAVIAVFTYHHSTARADRFEAGQKFLQNLNPDEIAGISVEGGAGGDAVTLSRQGDEYVIAERNGYVARNEQVNRVIRDLLEVTLERRMGQGDELAQELGLAGTEAVSVRIENSSGEQMVGLRLGEVSEGGGRYVQRTSGDDQAIYRTENALSVAADPASYLRKEIVDHSSSEVVRISGPDFVLAKTRDEDGTWQGELELEGGTTKSAEVNRLASLLSRLTFDEVYLADDPEVADLDFDRSLVYDLSDQSGYRIEVADRGDDRFLRLRGLFNVDRLEVSQDETDDQLKEKADVLRRSEEISRFDQYHGSWVFKVNATTGEKLDLARVDLVE